MTLKIVGYAWLILALGYCIYTIWKGEWKWQD